jgi:hypothetical protein
MDLIWWKSQYSIGSYVHNVYKMFTSFKFRHTEKILIVRRSAMVPETESQVVKPSHNDVELAGYHACAREAVLYLVNTEKIPQTDPLVTGLAEHLNKRQAHVEYQRLLEVAGEHACNATLRTSLILAAYRGCNLNYRQSEKTDII